MNILGDIQVECANMIRNLEVIKQHLRSHLIERPMAFVLFRNMNNDSLFLRLITAFHVFLFHQASRQVFTKFIDINTDFDTFN
ncbi:CLUMA_CG005653, isoform A [Clunio marinus]|uniref:CLUMA_CG005653, isoform A n=1 Tax=Clunio marinus TaxID=568069 RepID=A0A1J1I125_9DIPT|nr:CLUMA_CG005653, isoform A [Clunio marinus]